jgi:hypothetical protein
MILYASHPPKRRASSGRNMWRKRRTCGGRGSQRLPISASHSTRYYMIILSYTLLTGPNDELLAGVTQRLPVRNGQEVDNWYAGTVWCSIPIPCGYTRGYVVSPECLSIVFGHTLKLRLCERMLTPQAAWAIVLYNASGQGTQEKQRNNVFVHMFTFFILCRSISKGRLDVSTTVCCTRGKGRPRH